MPSAHFMLSCSTPLPTSSTLPDSRTSSDFFRPYKLYKMYFSPLATLKTAFFFTAVLLTLYKMYNLILFMKVELGGLCPPSLGCR